MAVAYRASGTFTEADSTSSGSIGLPAGLANGDVLVLVCQSRGTGNTVTTPSGYSLATTDNQTAGHRLTVFYKYVTNAGTEAAPSVTQSVSGAIRARLSAFSGCDSSSPLDVAAVSDRSTNNLTVTAPSTTPVSTGAMAVWCFSTEDDNTLNAATQGTTAYSSDGTLGADGAFALVYELQTTALPTGACSMTESVNGPDNWVTITLALRPAAPATSNPVVDLADGVTLAVEIAFSDAWNAPNPTFTDVTLRLRDEPGISIMRGRTSIYSDFQPGSLSFRLGNADRRFDPDYSAGPYFGLILPNRRVRVTARYNSTNYIVFDGFINAWNQGYDPPNDGYVDVTATDLMSWLSTWSCPETDLMVDVLTDRPTAYWTFNDDGVITDETGNGRDARIYEGTAVGSFLPGEPGRNARTVSGVGGVKQVGIRRVPSWVVTKTVTRNTTPTGNTTNVTFKKQIIWREKTVVSRSPAVTTTVFSAPSTDTIPLLYSVEAWVSFATIQPLSSFVITAEAANNTFVIRLGYDSSSESQGAYLAEELFDSNGGSAGPLLIPAKANTPYHVVATLDSDQQLDHVYLNGELYLTGSTAAFDFDGGTADGVCHITTTGQCTVDFAHIALYETTLSADRVVAHYESGKVGGEMASAESRLTRLSNLVGLSDAGLIDVTTFGTPHTYLSLAEYSSSIIDEMRHIMTAEQGRLYATRSGVLRAESRSANWDGTVSRMTTSRGTFGDSGSELPYMDIVLEPATADTVQNLTSVSVREGGVAVRDQDSIALYGEQPGTVDASLPHPVDGQNLARAIHRRFASPATRIARLDVTPRAAPTTLYPIVLAAEIGDRFIVRRRPQAVGSAIEESVQLEGVSHQFSTKKWNTTFFMGPAHETYTEGPWFIVGDNTYGVIGTAANNGVLR